jgi:hypothetical protein
MATVMSYVILGLALIHLMSTASTAVHAQCTHASRVHVAGHAVAAVLLAGVFHDTDTVTMQRML